MSPRTLHARPLRRLAIAALLGLGALAACGPKRGPTIDDPAAFLAHARARDVPFALQARFSVRIQTEKGDLSTTGGMLLHQPDRLRVEVYSPVGTPLLYLVSDGRALHLWDQTKETFYRGDDAVGVLAELAGGAVGLPDVVALLTGTLPLAEATVLAVESLDEGVVVALQGREGVWVRAIVDPRTELLRSMALYEGAPPPSVAEVPSAEALLSVTYTDLIRVGKSRLPEEIALSVPSLGLNVEVEVVSWDELGRIPDAFGFQPPTGATELDLIKTLQERAARPPP